MPQDLTAENTDLKRQLAEAQRQIEIMTKAITAGKVGAVSASKDPDKLKRQVEAAVKVEQQKADAISEANGAETAPIVVEYDSPDMDTELEEEDDDMGITNEELEAMGWTPLDTPWAT